MSKILVVTGLTGRKSGGGFAQKIIENIEAVREMFPDGIRAVVRATSHTDAIDGFIKPDCKYIGDVTDVEVLQKAFADADTVLHIAGIHFSKKVVDAAVCAKVRRLILVHTTGIYSKYKAAGEEYRQIDDYVYTQCKSHNIILTILRPTMIYGNIYDRNVITFIKMVDKLPIMPVVSGANYELQPVHYKDLSDAYYAVLINEEATGNKDFVLSGGAPVLLRDMLMEIGKNLDKKVKFVSVPFWLAYAGAWAIYLLSLSQIDYREKVQRLCEPRVYSHEEAKKAFGYSPRTFQEGVPGEVKEYLGHKTLG